MSIAAKVQNAQKYKTARPRCTVCLLIDDLPQEDAEALRQIIDSEDWAATHISRLLQDVGHSITQHTVRRHRNAECVRRSEERVRG